MDRLEGGQVQSAQEGVSILGHSIACMLTCQIYFTTSMPKTATGKVQRRMVADAMIQQEKRKAKL